MTCGQKRRAVIIRALRGAAEYIYTALTAVKDHALFDDGDSVKLLRPAVSEACLKAELNEKANGYGIKASVEGNGIDPDIHPRDACSLDADRARSFNYAVSEIGQVDTHVFVTVAVFTRIKNAIGLNTNRFSPSSGGTTGKSVIGHNLTSL